jgi:hypothetical protein
MSEILGDEDVMILIVRRDGADLTEPDLVEFLRPRVPRFMVPRYLEFVDSLPRTPTHKVRKTVLRERGVTAATWDGGPRAPTSNSTQAAAPTRSARPSGDPAGHGHAPPAS